MDNSKAAIMMKHILFIALTLGASPSFAEGLTHEETLKTLLKEVTVCAAMEHCRAEATKDDDVRKMYERSSLEHWEKMHVLAVAVGISRKSALDNYSNAGKKCKETGDEPDCAFLRSYLYERYKLLRLGADK